VNALIVYLVVGLAVGLVAPLIAGRQAMGFIGTCLIGAIGAFIGGVLGSYSLADDQFMVVRLAGIVHASIGAVVTLALVLFARDWEARTRSQLFTLGTAPKKKRNPHWSDGLLSSDRRSFETISKQHQRTP
jgi:uncharacterized membrane protein YeaQ/YmgE (transglycosylase-associated protein family)